jgi:hypothetical protein
MARKNGISTYPFLTVRQGFEGALTGTSTREQALARLQSYPLEVALDLISKLSSLLLFRSADDPEFTASAVNGIMGYKAPRVFAAVDRLRAQYLKDGSNCSVAVFEHAQLLVAAKLSLRYLTLSSKSPSGTEQFGEGLLMIGDLVGREIKLPKSADASNPTVLRAWVHYFALNGLFNVHEDRIHLLSRFYDLFFPPTPVGSGGVDIAAVLRATTGFSPTDYWTAAFSFLAHWSTIHPDTVGTTPSFISRTTYFTENFAYTDAEVEHFFRLFSRPEQEFRAELSDFDEELLWAGYYPLPLATTPLVAIGDKVFCPSPRLLLERMTDGLYHILLNGLAPVERNRFQIYCGELFQDYVRRLLVRVFSVVSKRKHGTFHGEDELARALRGPASSGFCDALIVRNDALILIECKAARLSLPRRSGLDPDGTIEKLREIYVDAVHQIYNTIEAIRAGRLTALGLQADTIRQYIPLVITLEHVPLRGLIHQALDESIRNNPDFSLAGVSPWQAFHISELEAAEGAMLAGSPLMDFLLRKAAHAVYSREGATNYCFALEDTFVTKLRSPYLEDKFRELSQAATLIHRGRAKDRQ